MPIQLKLDYEIYPCSFQKEGRQVPCGRCYRRGGDEEGLSCKEKTFTNAQEDRLREIMEKHGAAPV